ncbi:MAG: DUF2284 domain-containing protein [Lachnospiraceae bacterium]|nr:DUF2284 domain-containing protein [Lachnospiraceae bacterium]
MTHAEIEEFITQFPIYQYAFAKPEDINFDEDTRFYCKKECKRYGTSWSCPPAIGKISQLKDRCMAYTDVLFFSSVTEVKDRTDPLVQVESRETHERMTRIFEKHMKDNGLLTYTLSSGACSLCAKCGFPKEKCRHPQRMYPCIESYGIVAADLAEYCSMDFYMGENLLLWYSLILYRQ